MMQTITAAAPVIPGVWSHVAFVFAVNTRRAPAPVQLAGIGNRTFELGPWSMAPWNMWGDPTNEAKW